MSMDHVDLNNPQEAGLYYANYARAGIKQAFIARHPELLRVSKEADIRNEQVIDKIHSESGRPLTPENYEAAYAVALVNGLLTLPEPGTIEANPDDMVIYSDGLRQDGDGRIVNPPATEEEVMDKLSTAELRGYLERKYQTPAPFNLADALTGEGSYRWKKAREWNGTDEEAVAALRGNLRGTP
jgi:hypothetical protein